ncbi:cysteine-rich DPF motif domain-containing protein 1-like [Amphiura filiformis]|uniref:cysteine-rich DPF motif domain-containing protein 1-like n=1 Tax=Amphiura filiformis TaxID=82378 RepID=UPI003B217C35
MSDNKESSHFVCSLCDFSAPYDYFGNKPPFAKAIILMEKAFVIKDPFSPESKHLTIGGFCSVCDKPVCVGQNCSVFYTKRFCMTCTKDNIKEFPAEIQQELKKRPTTSTKD